MPRRGLFMTDLKKDRKIEKADKGKKKSNKRSPGNGYFLAMGIALGVGLGAAFDNVVMGLIIGIAIGTAIDWRQR